jgi:hypothetical protein
LTGGIRRNYPKEDYVLKVIPRIAVHAITMACLFAGLAHGDTVSCVHNDDGPLQGSRELVLEEVWRMGLAEEDPILGTIERVLVLDDGRILLLDTQMSRVVECDADGRFLRTLGRAGDGPGELTGPQDLVALGDGTLGLVADFPGRLVYLNPDGTPAGSVVPSVPWSGGDFLTLHRALCSGDNLLLGGSVMTMDPGKPVQERTFFLGRFDRDGNMMTEYARGQASFDMRSGELHESWQEFVWSRMDVAADGTVVVAVPRDAFELSWFAADGTPLLKATLPMKPWQRNARARERMQGILQHQADHLPGTQAVIAPTEPTIVDLSLHENGDVWCLTSRSMWETERPYFAAYDVITAKGRFKERVQVICDGDATRDRLMFAGGRFYRIAGYWDAVFKVQSETPDRDAEPMSVTCYRVRQGDGAVQGN